MQTKMKDRVALISGAASGMGRAIVERFLNEGALVVGFSLEEQTDLQHNNYTYVSGDIANFEDCKKAVEVAIEKYGKLDCLVNSAGIVHEGTLESTTMDTFKKVFEVNTIGTIAINKAAITYLKKQPSTIVNISSDMSVKPLQERIAYNPSKAAVNMITKCIALEYAPNVRCNTILPGVIHTPMIQKRLDQCDDPKVLMDFYKSLYPLGRIGNVDDIVDGVIFLSCDDSKWISGIELPICGGPL